LSTVCTQGAEPTVAAFATCGVIIERVEDVRTKAKNRMMNRRVICVKADWLGAEYIFIHCFVSALQTNP
jgi:hypothetical protein